MARPDIWLGDLLRSFVQLEVRDAHIAAEIREMLQIDAIRGPVSETPSGAWRETRPPPVREPKPVEPLRADGPQQQPARSSASGSVERSNLRLVQASQRPASVAPPSWFASVSALAKAADAVPPAQIPAPLFPKQQSRALLSTALSTWAGDGTPDIPRMVEVLARLEPITRLPEAQAPTLRRGAQVLLDVSIAMAPYRHDVATVEKQIERLTASGAVTSMRFKGCPVRASTRGAERAAQAWRPPARGTPIMVLSDLGIGGPMLNDDHADIADWLEFARRARAAGCLVTVLVPYGPSRWPRALARAMWLIHWDRHTRAASIRQRPNERNPGARRESA